MATRSTSTNESDKLNGEKKKNPCFQEDIAEQVLSLDDASRFTLSAAIAAMNCESYSKMLRLIFPLFCNELQKNILRSIRDINQVTGQVRNLRRSAELHGEESNCSPDHLASARMQPGRKEGHTWLQSVLIITKSVGSRP